MVCNVFADATKRKHLEEQAKTLHTIQTKKWVDRCDAYEQNKSILCGLIAKRCNTELSDKLESRPGHQEWTLDMPLLYLRMIMQECIASAENVYPCDTQLKTFKDLHNIKQGPEKSIADYTKGQMAQAPTSVGKRRSIQSDRDEPRTNRGMVRPLILLQGNISVAGVLG
jgi:hypothetical protein